MDILDSQTTQAPTLQAQTTQPPTRYLGIDIAKAKFDCALLLVGKPNQPKQLNQAKQGDTTNKPYKHSYKDRQFTNDFAGYKALVVWLNDLHIDTSQLHICMEATGVYSEDLAAYLIDLGIRVSVVNPARIASFSRSENICGKTDIQDARGIALFCARMQPAVHIPAPASERALLHLARQRQHLKLTLQAEQNRLSTCAPVIRGSITQVIETLERELAVLEQAMKDHIDDNPELKQNKALLSTIPGVADITAAWLLAYLGNGERFERGKQAAKFAGLAPREWVSGSSVRGKTSISKTGSSELRAVLYMPAMAVFCRSCGYPEFVARLRASGKNNKQIIVAVMRKILTIAQAVLRSKIPFDRSFHATLA